MSVLTMLFQDFADRLCSTEFLQDARHADHPTAFSRCRKLPLPTLVAIMLTGMRMSMQAELDTFFAHLLQQAQLVREVSEQAFAQARAKLSPSAIPGLNDWLIVSNSVVNFPVVSAGPFERDSQTALQPLDRRKFPSTLN